MTESLQPFQFITVPSIHVEWGAAQRLGELLRERFTSRQVLLVTDPGLVKCGLIEPLRKSLEAHHFRILVFDQIVPDPPESLLLNCVEFAKQSGVELVLGVGGGSSSDVAKLAAVLLKSGQPLSSMYGIGNVKGERLPLALVPTTSGTGSEVTNISILTTGETTKMGVVSPQLYADFVLLDAELTLGLPALHTAATGIDAMVHAIEAYTGRNKKNPISDALACKALSLLSSNIVTACRDGKNRLARENMLLGAMLAGQAFSNSPVAAVHALAYPLGGHYHIPHGLSNALMLGSVLRFNSKAAATLYAELAEVIQAPGTGDTENRCAAFVAEMERLMNDSGAPRRLRDAGVRKDSLSQLASDAMKQTRLLVNNPVEVSESDALALYQEAY